MTDGCEVLGDRALDLRLREVQFPAEDRADGLGGVDGGVPGEQPGAGAPGEDVVDRTGQLGSGRVDDLRLRVGESRDDRLGQRRVVLDEIADEPGLGAIAFTQVGGDAAGCGDGLGVVTGAAQEREVGGAALRRAAEDLHHLVDDEFAHVGWW